MWDLKIVQSYDSNRDFDNHAHDPSKILISLSIINTHKKYSLQNTKKPNINTKKHSNLKFENQAR